MVLHSLLDSLTTQQREAVCHLDGPLLILAGPGSGKTRVTTHRIAWLLEQGVPAWQIVALTFTNKAADEMRARVAALAPGANVWVSTFHRFCARLLRTYGSMVGLDENFTIYDSDDSRKALQRVMRALEMEEVHVTVGQVAAEISRAKNRMETPDSYKAGYNAVSQVAGQVYSAYQARLMASAAADFDDLLLYAARLLKENPELRRTLDERFRYVLVDEYQDTNLVQYALVRGLSIDHPNLAVTGDPDQSVYSWRGADIGNILSFELDFDGVKIVRLERNYRSTKSILRVAQGLILHNHQRKEKSLFTENEEGELPRLIEYADQMHEAHSIAVRVRAEVQSGRRRYSDYAVFYRTNALSRSVEMALRSVGVPYQVVSGLEFYQRAEIKDMLAYLQLINNPRDDVALLRVINTPPRGIGKTTVNRLVAYATGNRLPLLEAARQAGLIDTISKRAAVLIAKFVAMQDQLREQASGPVAQILRAVLEGSGYREHLKESSREEDEERLANIEELVTAARQFDEQNPGAESLQAFLEQTALVNETDNWEQTTDRVTLMTLHAAKGLEFPVVFLIAVEDGLLPHQRSRDHTDQLEEERRLMFVGITRAMEEVYISHAATRDFRGANKPTVPSSFLMELPRDQMEVVSHARTRGTRPGAQYGDEYCQDDPRPQGLGQARDDAPATEIDDPSSRYHAAPIGAPALTTAAELLGASANHAGAYTFRQGMDVVHPEYGLGTIVALAGGESLRVATVSFAQCGEKKFVVNRSPLRPADSEGAP